MNYDKELLVGMGFCILSVCLVPLSCQTRHSLKQQFTLSQFWGTEIWNQGCSKQDWHLLGALRKPVPCLSPSFSWWPAVLGLYTCHSPYCPPLDMTSCMCLCPPCPSPRTLTTGLGFPVIQDDCILPPKALFPNKISFTGKGLNLSLGGHSLTPNSVFHCSLLRNSYPSLSKSVSFPILPTMSANSAPFPKRC